MSKSNNMGFLSREEVERLRSIYPPGRIVMNRRHRRKEPLGR